MPPQARQLWFRDYLRTVIQRDIKDLSGARRTQDPPKLLKLLAARTAGELVVRNLHDDTGFGSRHTTEAYLGYLQMTYLVLQLPAWSRNLTSKATLVSGGREPPPPALLEPYVTVSRHTAPTVRRWVEARRCQ